jgi:hypothetical protein
MHVIDWWFAMWNKSRRLNGNRRCVDVKVVDGWLTIWNNSKRLNRNRRRRDRSRLIMNRIRIIKRFGGSGQRYKSQREVWV